MAEILVVSSKVKKFIREKSELSTSAEFIEALSHRIENLCLESAARARADKRKTLKARDLI
jgi:histone H3/H4